MVDYTKIPEMSHNWDVHPRWQGVTRDYAAEDVLRLRGSVEIQHTLATVGARKLWYRLNNEPFTRALGALTGNQAMQMVKAGLRAMEVALQVSDQIDRHRWT